MPFIYSHAIKNSLTYSFSEYYCIYPFFYIVIFISIIFVDIRGIIVLHSAERSSDFFILAQIKKIILKQQHYFSLPLLTSSL
jgi:hypothetical protein